MLQEIQLFFAVFRYALIISIISFLKNVSVFNFLYPKNLFCEMFVPFYYPLKKQLLYHTHTFNRVPVQGIINYKIIIIKNIKLRID